MKDALKKKALLFIGILLIAGGLSLFSYYIYNLFNSDGNIPYKYLLRETGKPSKFTELHISGNEDLIIKKYENRLPALDKPAATFYTAERKNSPPVLIDYKSDSPFPLIMLPVSNEVYQALYTEILKNTGEGDLLMSWWDNCLRIKLFTGRSVLTDEYIGYPLFIPDVWQKYSKAISDFERGFWKGKTAKEAEGKFRRYTDAMLSGEEEGYRILKALSQGKKTFIIADFRDLNGLNELTKGKFSLEYKEFVLAGDIHGTIKQVKVWMNEKGIKDYMVEPLGDGSARVYYLTKDEDKAKLIVKLLPFTSSNPFNLEKFKLRYQKGSIYVYELM